MFWSKNTTGEIIILMKYLGKKFLDLLTIRHILCPLYASKNPGVWGRAPTAIFSTTSGIGG
jgi:hypothetical protein